VNRQSAASRGIRLRLVVVVRDGDQILVCREHDTGVWRLPATPWTADVNPVEAVRTLLADRAGLIVSPTLRAPVRLSATAGLLLFTAKPLNIPPAMGAATPLWKWLSPLAVPALLPPGDQQWVSITSSGDVGQNVDQAASRSGAVARLVAFDCPRTRSVAH
jgi:hypothetical protein